MVSVSIPKVQRDSFLCFNMLQDNNVLTLPYQALEIIAGDPARWSKGILYLLQPVDNKKAIKYY